jgi:hypothetical protein
MEESGRDLLEVYPVVFLEELKKITEKTSARIASDPS